MLGISDGDGFGKADGAVLGSGVATVGAADADVG